MPRNSTQNTYSTSASKLSPGYSNVGISQIPTDPLPTQTSGLYIFGEITDRTRRTIPTRDSSTAEIVTYTVQDTVGHRYYVDEYSPEVYTDIGAMVEIPVYVKTFKKRNGDIGHSICVQQQLNSSSRGERF